jgi:Trk K+ transport system NAD-binding subunit
LYEKDAADYKLVAVTVPPNGSIIGKTLDKLELSENCRIATVFRNGGFEFPTQSFMFKGGDRVVVAGAIKDAEKATQKLTNVEVT